MTAIGNGAARPATRSHGRSPGWRPGARRPSSRSAGRTRDGVRGEGGRHEPAQSSVVGRIQLQQRHRALAPVESTPSAWTPNVGPGEPGDTRGESRSGNRPPGWEPDPHADGPPRRWGRDPTTLREVQPRVRIPAEPPVPRDRGAHHDELTGQGHDSVHESSHVGAAVHHASWPVCCAARRLVVAEHRGWERRAQMAYDGPVLVVGGTGSSGDRWSTNCSPAARTCAPWSGRPRTPAGSKAGASRSPAATCSTSPRSSAP